ncbi:hypothetical protein C1H46_003966 [Malus baccata]|uniref:Uncharacterized protein n=1 Tax=Malus baccata TaxID=106549 RepID=A0A540NH82_MALBA|nr:hypothetical protein C1H46_003966 [Malus baccata]
MVLVAAPVDATELVELASKCLQYEAKDRSEITSVSSIPPPIADKGILKSYRVASLVLMGLTKTPVVMPTIPSLGKARIQMDLSAVHEILLKTGYSDEEGAENELAISVFDPFDPVLDPGGDRLVAMMSVPSGTILVRRALSYLSIASTKSTTFASASPLTKHMPTIVTARRQLLSSAPVLHKQPAPPTPHDLQSYPHGLRPQLLTCSRKLTKCLYVIHGIICSALAPVGLCN